MREWNRVRKTCEQKKRVSALLKLCNVKLNSNDGCGIPEIRCFQTYFKTLKIKLKVFEYETFGSGVALIYDGGEDMPGEYEKTIYIMYYAE